MTPRETAVMIGLAEYLEESHGDEVATDHAGDGPDNCSYCEIITEARALCGVVVTETGDDERGPDIQDDDLRLDHIPDVDETRALLATFEADFFWPEVYHVNERGNVDLLSLTDDGARIVRSWV